MTERDREEWRVTERGMRGREEGRVMEKGREEGRVTERGRGSEGDRER